MTADLIVIVPTRSRPGNVETVVRAWRDTGAFRDGALLHFVVDRDDPEYGAYETALTLAQSSEAMEGNWITWGVQPTWRPLVPKLNAAAVDLTAWSPFALGFAGDDHVPRSKGWAAAYVKALRDGAGIVYGDDGYQGENLPTEWAMRADIVKALGRMVPAPVDHLYCDNAVRDLGQAAGLLRWMPEVHIEHMHPVAGKAPSDAQYDRVNGRQQYRGDRAAYRHWRDVGMHADVALIEELRRGETQA